LRLVLGTVGAVFVLIVLGVLLLVAFVWGGVRLLMAGRELDDGSTQVPIAPRGGVAHKVDRRLQHARATLETLVMPEVEQEELEPSAGAYRHRAQTYLVLGTGLLGLAAALVIGVLLVM
jgi:hypothetical protein